MRILVVAVGTLLLAGCGVGGGTEVVGEPGSGGGDTGRREVVVFAAASLADVMAEVETAFEEGQLSIDVRVSVGGSSALREQILDGAPADLFLSANEEVMGDVVQAGAVQQTPKVVAYNELVLAVPADNPANVSQLADLAASDLYLGLCSPEVPCGTLAQRVLDAASIEVAVATEEPDVRSLSAKVASGELDAGLVYATDVLAANRSDSGLPLTAIQLDAGEVARTSYNGAVLKEAPNRSDATALLEFLVSDAGQSILAEHGLLLP